ncbi:unnamed protein product [Prorocentrum cordatum]|uniref:Uncharacterized protein n=1 Tax=Prorocentrum cordatum TaxID=2364126 RepID=A0ABN9V8D9_9DINO|nr:unnamed protein product [Polarella glacialis]
MSGPMWPLILGGLGLGALAARQGMRAAQRSGLKAPEVSMPKFGGFSFARGSANQGFESPMTRAEAKQILNCSGMNPTKDVRLAVFRFQQRCWPSDFPHGLIPQLCERYRTR